MSIEAGTRVGRYEIQAPVGAGGMGEVWLATDAELNRPVALKFLHAEVASDERRMQRFMQEARATSALSHPNILTVYDIGQTEDGARFFATESVAGTTLREHMNSRRLRASSRATPVRGRSRAGAKIIPCASASGRSTRRTATSRE